MEADKEQSQKNLTEGIVVKDYEGNFKVLSDGELKDADALLSATETSHKQSLDIASSQAPVSADRQVTFPSFTDLAIIPTDEHFVQKPVDKRPGVPVDFHFHPEDTDEAARELDKINTLFDLAPQKQYSINKITDKLIEKHGLTFTSDERIACIKLLLSYFRQMRSLVETRVRLIQAKREGGFGIASETADHMLAVLKHLKTKIEEMDGIVVEADMPSPPAPSEPPVSPTVISKPEQPTAAPSVGNISTVETKKREMPSVAPRIISDRPSVRRTAALESTTSPSLSAQPTASTLPVNDALPVREETPQTVQTPVPRETSANASVTDIPKIQRPSVQTAKTPIIEVRKPQINAIRAGRPMGRVEELALMDIATWRMLDPDPRIRAGKILGKIQNLEQESFTRKSQGIQAWRSNEVYQHYLTLGQMSLEQKKDIADVIQAVTTQGQNTLSLDEFEAISDLNRTLRF